MAAVHLPADNPFRILHNDAPLSLRHFDDYDNHEKGDQGKQQHLENIDGTCLNIFVYSHAAIGEPSYDTGKDDQRNAIADAARRNLVAQPHEEARAGRQNNRYHKYHSPAVVYESIIYFQRIAHGKGLDEP